MLPPFLRKTTQDPPHLFIQAECIYATLYNAAQDVHCDAAQSQTS
jgi:hypothetical protein